MPINLRDWSRTAAQRGWGAGWPSCNGIKAVGTVAVTADRSGVRVSVHPRIARLVDLLMDESERRGFLLKPGQCGAYNCRPIAGTNVPSNHSWGLAIDINWQDNPYTSTGRHTIPDWMYALWARYGFANGSMYRGKQDFMHFEAMGTPAEMDAMTALALREIGGASPTATPIAAPAPPKPKGIPKMIERRLTVGNNHGRIVCPAEARSKIASEVWVSVSGEGGCKGRVAFQTNSDTDGAPAGSGPAWDLALRNGNRAAKRIPATTEFLEYWVTVNGVQGSGEGSLLVEFVPR